MKSQFCIFVKWYQWHSITTSTSTITVFVFWDFTKFFYFPYLPVQNSLCLNFPFTTNWTAARTPRIELWNRVVSYFQNSFTWQIVVSFKSDLSWVWIFEIWRWKFLSAKFWTRIDLKKVVHAIIRVFKLEFWEENGQFRWNIVNFYFDLTVNIVWI